MMLIRNDRTSLTTKIMNELEKTIQHHFENCHGVCHENSGTTLAPEVNFLNNFRCSRQYGRNISLFDLHTHEMRSVIAGVGWRRL